VGLKTFIQLSYEEKATQLMELSRIILGIRLFNREEGRGGAGLDTMDKDSNLLANVLSQDIAMVITPTVVTVYLPRDFDFVNFSSVLT